MDRLAELVGQLEPGRTFCLPLTIYRAEHARVARLSPERPPASSSGQSPFVASGVPWAVLFARTSQAGGFVW